MALEKRLNIQISERKANYNTANNTLKKLSPRLDNAEKFTISGFQVMNKQMDTTNVELLNLKKRDNKNMSLPDPT